MTTESLDNIGRHFGTDKSSLHHDYLRFYERFLAELRSADKLTVLEIGVNEGASVRMWEQYFTCALVIGVDINPAAAVHARDRIRIEIANQSDVADLVALATKYGPFDLVVDDGSHLWDNQITTFQWLYPFVRQGRYYILEDIDTSYGGYAETYRGSSQISAASYLQRFTDCMVGDVALDLSDQQDAFIRSFARKTEFIAFHRRTAVIRRRW